MNGHGYIVSSPPQLEYIVGFVLLLFSLCCIYFYRKRK